MTDTSTAAPAVIPWEPDARSVGGFSKQTGYRVWNGTALQGCKFPGPGRARVITSKYAALLGIEITAETVRKALAWDKPRREAMLQAQADYRRARKA